MFPRPHRLLIVSALAAVTAVCGIAAPAAARPAADTALVRTDLADHMSTLLPGRMASARLGGAPGAVLAVDVLDGRTGRVLFSRGASTPARAASATKLITAAIALQTMGAAHRFTTPVRLVSTSGSAGARTATIALVGGGDPLMTSADLDRLAKVTVTKLRERGVTAARVLIDDTLFPVPTRAAGWPDSYGLDVVRPVRPLVRDSQMLNDVAADAGRYFTARLVARGLTGGTRVTAAYAGRQRTLASSPVISRLSGHTVQETVTRMLRISENQDAEMLFRLSSLASGRGATWSGGTSTALAVLTGLDVPVAGVVLRDGSGASRDDRIPPRTLSMLLRRALSTVHPELWPLYYGGAMPTAGRTGSLSGRYLTAPSKCAAVNTLAKTGALRDVLSLSGVTVGTDGVPKVFTILLQNPPTSVYGGMPVRVAIDGLVATINGCW